MHIAKAIRIDQCNPPKKLGTDCWLNLIIKIFTFFLGQGNERCEQERE